MEHQMRCPISEIFTSPQGEGLWSGTLMVFVRFAGCSVGKQPFIPGNCCTYDGRKFDCDTDFSRSQWLTIEQLLERVANITHVCLTGGEPLDHKIGPIVSELIRNEHFVHLETSGTKPLYKDIYPPPQWTSCSPKQGMLAEWWEQADEFKFLVDEEFESEFVPKLGGNKYIWLQPVNYRDCVDKDNLQRCLRIMEKHQNWRLSPQIHKLIGVR